MPNKLVALFHGNGCRRGVERAISVFKVVCYVVCGAIALYMLVHRFLHLTSGFQFDELYSAVTASPKLSFPFIWREMLLWDVNLPLFNVLLFGWNRVFPFTPFWMHLFSALLGTGAVVAAWMSAPKYWEPLKKWIFVTLMAGSFVLVCYGPIVRSYSLSVLLSTLFTLQALRIIHRLSKCENPPKWTWLGFLGTGLLGSYSHYFCAGVFFITALVVFLYACYYKTGRAWSFWGTALVFGLWSFWVMHTWLFLREYGNGWWYRMPIPKAIWEVITFLFGSRNVFLGLLYGSVLALVSLVFTYRKSFFKQADIVLPLAQIVLLCAVVAGISVRYNLWMDRYFLPLMPGILLLLAGFIHHLYKRHAVLLVLWPVLLCCWVKVFWVQDYLYTAEFTGLRAAFSYLVNERKADKVLMDMEDVGYPYAALPHMMKFYVPEGTGMEVIRLTAQTAPLAWESEPKIPVVQIACSPIHLIESAIKMNMDEDENGLYTFGKNVCVYTVHPLGSRSPVNKG